MKFSVVDRIRDRSSSVSFRLTILSFVLSGSVALAETKQKTKPSATPQPTLTPKPTGSPRLTAAPTPSPTPETKIDAKMEAELLQAEERFVNAIRNRDAKELEALLHPLFADSLEGGNTAVRKHSVIKRATAGDLPAFHIERERKLIRSGDSFTVEGLGKDTAHELTEDKPTEQWAFVRRLWSRENGRWIATAQIIAPLEEKELREKLEAETQEKQPH